MHRRWIGSALILGLIGIGVGSYLLFFSSGSGSLPDGVTQGGQSIASLETINAADRPEKTFALTAEEKEWTFEEQESVEAWTYNGTVPGQELRVEQGDFVQVDVTNNLDVPVTIHWHGVNLANNMDGVPGLTQDAVQPGESFTYKFVAEDAGTYWYHSHQHSSKQVDKGLYGPLVVEDPKENGDYEVEETLMLDEWPVHQAKDGPASRQGMMESRRSGDGEADTKDLYDTFTVNGKAGEAIDPLEMEQGETARLRLVNAGFQQHQLAFPEGAAEVIAVDGEKTSSSGDSSANIVEIAPGERIDVAYTKQDQTPVFLGEPGGNEKARDMRIPVLPEGTSRSEAAMASPDTETTARGADQSTDTVLFDQVPEPDVSYTMDLSMGMDMGGGGMSFQINGRTFPDTPPIQVQDGDIVKVEIENNGSMNHPMHLHGHDFQIQSQDGTALDQPSVKDLVHVKPGESYTIYFEANNKGEWLFHCHDNNHAELGMSTIVDYDSVYSPYDLGGDAENHPS